MADDIDIEEHDVLDNPRIRNMFPDLSIIKTEVQDVDADHNMEYDPYEPMEHYDPDFHDNVSHDPALYEDQFPEHSLEEQVEYPQNHNKIILGSKPCKSPFKDVHIEENSHIYESALIFGRPQHINGSEEFGEFDEDEEYPRQGSVFILGSKPSKVNHDVNDAVVVLDDWGPKLEENPCYCKDCLILFPTRNAVDAHNMMTHSFLVALDKPYRSPSNEREVKNTARKSTGMVSTPSTSKWRSCNHCQKIFKDESMLIQHLYEVMTADKPKSDKNNAEFSKQPVTDSIIKTENVYNDSYRCIICGFISKYIKPLKRHMFINHGITDYEPRLVKFTGECSHCAVMINRVKNFNTHIQNVHSQLFSKKPSILKKRKVFSAQNELHSAKKHLDTKNQIDSVSAIGKNPISNTSLTDNTLTSDTKLRLVPLNIIFRCNECKTHFTSCTAAVKHSKVCMLNKVNVWKCSLCKRNWPVDEKIVHQHQHRLCNKFTVFNNFDDSTPGKVLRQCPDCSLYFHEMELDQHGETACEESKAIECDNCEILLHNSSIETHKQWHRDIDFGKKDLILIDCKTIDSTIALKRKSSYPDDELPQPKKLRYRSDVIYYCANCKSCMRRKKNMEKHINGDCKNFKNYICLICGCAFLNKKHQREFHGDKEFVLSDYRFLRVSDESPIAPPIPVYPKCDKCQVNFCKIVSVREHEGRNCKDDHKTCKYCKQKFSNLAYKVHLPLHEYEQTKEMTASPKIELPELLQKYEMFTSTWNILYSCGNCDFVSDSYDTAVEHCHNHLNNMADCDVTIVNCLKCELKFDAKCYDRHRELHAGNESINRNSFKILMFYYKDLLSNEWLVMFEKLPQSQVDQILFRSIYNVSRSVKMSIVVDGPPGLTLYKCGKCEKYVHPSTVSNHNTFESCFKKGRSFSCQICSIPFSSYKGCSKHQLVHQNDDCKDSKDFRIVAFNNPDEIEFNRAILSIDAKKHDDNKKTVTYNMYKCAKCNSCSTQKANFIKHNCVEGKMLKRCLLCDGHFPNSYFHSHMEQHKRLPGFIKRNIKFLIVEPENDVAKIYKCHCGLHFASSNSFDKHQEVCNPALEVAKENCSKCGHLFDTDELFKHLCKHHSSDKYTKFEVELQKIPLFKCGACKLLFCSKVDLSRHFSVCDSGSGKTCSKCGLVFFSSLLTHLLRHKNCDRMKEKDYNIVTVYGTNSAKELKNKCSLYKCPPCNIHYMTQKSINRHLQLEHKDNVKLKKCKYCKLVFNIRALGNHVQHHHVRLKLRRKDIRIIELSNSVEIDITDYDSNETIKPESAPNSTINKKPQNDDTDVPRRRTKVGNNILYKCKFCSLHFNKKGELNKHIKTTSHISSKNFSSKCSKCGYMFTPSSLSQHMYLHHKKEKLKRKDFIIKVFGKAPSLNVKKKCLKSVKKLNTKKPILVPASIAAKYTKTLYKCRKCNIHFMSHGALYSHSVNHLTKSKSKCNYCKLTFPNKSLETHEQVHHRYMKLNLGDFRIQFVFSDQGYKKKKKTRDYTDDEIKKSQGEGMVQEIMNSKAWNKRINNRNILYKCELCDLHFIVYNTISKHFWLNKHRNRGEKCKLCGLHFTIWTMKRHVYMHHQRTKHKREDFKIISFKSTPRKSMTGTKLSDNSNEASDSDVDIEEYECEKETEGIIEKNECVGSKPRTSVNIVFEDNISSIDSNCDARGAESLDFERINDTQHDADNTSIMHSNILFKCYECDGHFFKEETFTMHIKSKIHNLETMNCYICGLSFNHASLSRHINIHHTAANLKAEDFHIIGFAQNYLYKCHKCGSHSMKEPSLMKHVLGCGHTAMPKYACDICGLDFGSGVLYHHKVVHHDKMKLKREDFTILKIVNNKFEIESLELSAEDTPGSIEYNTPKQPATKFYINSYSSNLYKCSTCHVHFLSEKNLEIHEHRDSAKTEVSQQKSTQGYNECPTCGLTFTDICLSRHMYIHHEVMNLELEELNVICKTDKIALHIDETENTKDSESNVSNDDTITTPSTSKGFSTPEDTKQFYRSRTYKLSRESLKRLDMSKYSRTLFRCSLCSNHYLTSHNADSHLYKCDGNTMGSKCSACSYKFGNFIIAKHIYVHHEKMRLSRKDFDVVVKARHIASDIKTAKIVESLNSIESNIEAASTLKDENQTLKLENVSIPNTYFYDNKLFKCSKCSVHFLTIAALELHLRNVDHNKLLKTPCTICNLNFSIRAIPIHTSIHHDSMNLKIEDFNIVSDITKENGPDFSKADETVVSQSSEDDEAKCNPTISPSKNTVKLYKCGECNVYYLTQSSCYKHAVKHVPLEPKEYIECKLCTFQFTILSLHKHILNHHHTDFDLEKVLIEEYQPNLLSNDSPKIDIYYAVDKVQSRLVSTTSEIKSSDILKQSLNIDDDVKIDEHRDREIEDKQINEDQIVRNVDEVVNSDIKVTKQIFTNSNVEKIVQNDNPKEEIFTHSNVDEVVETVEETAKDILTHNNDDKVEEKNIDEKEIFTHKNVDEVLERDLDAVKEVFIHSNVEEVVERSVDDAKDIFTQKTVDEPNGSVHCSEIQKNISLRGDIKDASEVVSVNLNDKDIKKCDTIDEIVSRDDKGF